MLNVCVALLGLNALVSNLPIDNPSTSSSLISDHVTETSNQNNTPVQTLRIIPTWLQGFEILSEHYQKAGLELRGVVSETSGSGYSNYGGGQSSVSSSNSAIYIGLLKAFPPVPSVGTFRGKIPLRKEREFSPGFLEDRGNIRDKNADGTYRSYEELEVTVSLANGTCKASWSREGKNYSETCAYVKKGESIVLFDDGLRPSNHLLCRNWNPYIRSELKLTPAGLVARVFEYNSAGDDFDQSFTLVKATN